MRVKISMIVALLAAALFFQTPGLAKETEKKPSKGEPIPDSGPWIDVLTFNIWNIIGAQDAKVRAVAIGRKIAELDPDLVAFEEAFDQGKRKLLIDNLKKAEYDLGEYRYFRYLYGSGLFLISRYPIVSAQFEKYRIVGGAKNIEWLAGKGIVHVRLRTPYGPLDFFHTHAIARMTDVFDKEGNYIPGDPQENDRLLQMYQIQRFIAAHRGSRTRAMIVAGDFNVSPEMLEYRFLKSVTGFQNSYDVVYPDSNPSTYSVSNQYVTQECSRIDHIFYKNFEGREGFWLLPVDSRIEMIDLFTNPADMKEINYSDHFGLFTRFKVIRKEDDRPDLSPCALTPWPCKCKSCLRDDYRDGTLTLSQENFDYWEELALSLIAKAWDRQDRKNQLIPLMADVVTAEPGAVYKLPDEPARQLEALIGEP